MPTYCLWCSTGVSFRFRVGLETPSVPCTFGSWPWEELRRFAGGDTDRAATTAPRFVRRPCPDDGDRSLRSGAALLHDIKSALVKSGRGGRSGRRSGAALVADLTRGMPCSTSSRSLTALWTAPNST